ncbi:MAG: DUF350 domain-containing protein [Anaerolineae bacterium]
MRTCTGTCAFAASTSIRCNSRAERFRNRAILCQEATWPSFLSGAQLVISIVTAALVAYLSIWLFDKTTRNIDEWNELRKGNVAVGVVLASIIVGVGLILRPGLAPAALNLDVGPTNAVVIRLVV